MPRRGSISKRDVLPDPLYNSKLATKLVNNVMYDGKKGVAQTIVYDAFKMIEEKLDSEFVRVVGDVTMPVKTLCLGLGSVGFAQIDMLVERDCDLFITGEVGEVCTLEYVRDACYFGEKKAVILFGHFSAEYAGMRLLAEHLDHILLPTIYLHGGEVYSKIT